MAGTIARWLEACAKGILVVAPDLAGHYPELVDCHAGGRGRAADGAVVGGEVGETLETRRTWTARQQLECGARQLIVLNHHL
eukprot:scaffold5138_cov125-Isochrysis_galbana.AAC.4